MRPIKFRAWDKKEKLMYPWPFIVHHFDDEIRVTKLDRSDFKRIPMADIELMQFTGLKDKNGREIYEGDLLEGIIGAVEWGEYCEFEGEFNIYHEGWHCNGFDHLQSRHENDYEVIGNLHENPELLAKKEP